MDGSQDNGTETKAGRGRKETRAEKNSREGRGRRTDYVDRLTVVGGEGTGRAHLTMFLLSSRDPPAIFAFSSGGKSINSSPFERTLT